LDPSKNIYLRWILTGGFGEQLPTYLLPENYATIRRNLHKLKWHQSSVEQYLETADDRSFNIFNLSDMFEYVSKERYVETLNLLIRKSAPEARLIYWNMLATRCRPISLCEKLRPLKQLSEQLYKTNQTFFYCRLVVEEVIC
jgi:S-adenosylmethionine-diacylglycerol 3-amino-3-carboxypropyl transferase